jgi:hypothetical protein
MYHDGRLYELMQRTRTTDDSTHPAGSVLGEAKQTVGLAAVLTAVPMAVVVAGSYPVVATVVLTLTVGMGLASRYLRRDRLLPAADPNGRPEDYPSVHATQAPD